MNVVSFSLWGDKPKYTVGALRNAQLAGIYYRGWECRFYCDEETVPNDIISSLQSMSNSKVILMDASKEAHWSMFWRFYAAEDSCVDHVVFRDADSRITQRETMAVQEWIASGKSFHVMRDHPHHGAAMCGGMWGVKGGVLKNIQRMIDEFCASEQKKSVMFGMDQDFLLHKVWPIARDSMVEHDEFFSKRPFPMRRDPRHFVGQVYDEMDNPTSLEFI
jgi:hypothetical protein